VFLPGGEYAVESEPSSWRLQLLRALRDEAHALRSVSTASSGLSDETSASDIPPGPKRVKELLAISGSIDAIQLAVPSRSLRRRVVGPAWRAQGVEFFHPMTSGAGAKLNRQPKCLST